MSPLSKTRHQSGAKLATKQKKTDVLIFLNRKEKVFLWKQKQYNWNQIKPGLNLSSTHCIVCNCNYLWQFHEKGQLFSMAYFVFNSGNRCWGLGVRQANNNIYWFRYLRQQSPVMSTDNRSIYFIYQRPAPPQRSDPPPIDNLESQGG